MEPAACVMIPCTVLTVPCIVICIKKKERQRRIRLRLHSCNVHVQSKSDLQLHIRRDVLNILIKNELSWMLIQYQLREPPICLSPQRNTKLLSFTERHARGYLKLNNLDYSVRPLPFFSVIPTRRFSPSSIQHVPPNLESSPAETSCTWRSPYTP
jgi:hypothetical protein